MIVLDSSVLIAHLDESADQHERATELLVEAAGSRLAASPLTLAEVLAGPARAGRLGEAHAALGTLAIEEVRLRADAAARLAILHAETDLSLTHCYVMLAAQDAGAEILLTCDDRLAAAARRAKLTVP